MNPELLALNELGRTLQLLYCIKTERTRFLVIGDLDLLAILL